MHEVIKRQWRALASGYRREITEGRDSSTYLREEGLKPTVKRLLGDCSKSRVLDVGTGNGWLFRYVEIGEPHACDLVRPPALPSEVDFRCQDAAELSYPDAYFDAVVSNIMLCYCEDIDTPLRQMARVSRPGATLVLSLVHPYFYRTGRAAETGEYCIEQDLSRSKLLDIDIGNRVGPFPYFYHPYPAYLNGIVAAGWRIREVCDWFMNADAYRTRFGATDTVKRSPKVPIFTFFAAEKL